SSITAVAIKIATCSTSRSGQQYPSSAALSCPLIFRTRLVRDTNGVCARETDARREEWTSISALTVVSCQLWRHISASYSPSSGSFVTVTNTETSSTITHNTCPTNTKEAARVVIYCTSSHLAGCA